MTPISPVDSSSPPTALPHRLKRLWREHRHAFVIAGLVIVGLSLAWGRVDFEQLHTWAEHVDPRLLFLALVFLPLITCPVTPLNIIAGIRFGLAGGLAFVAAAILTQHVVAFFTARLLPRMVRRKLDPLRKKLPRHAHFDASIFTSLLPGAPYWAQLYVLPLIGVPLGVFVIVSGFLHAIRSIVALLAGEISHHPSLLPLIGLGIYSTSLALACFFAGRRLKRKYGQIR